MKLTPKLSFLIMRIHYLQGPLLADVVVVPLCDVIELGNFQCVQGDVVEPKQNFKSTLTRDN